MTWTQIICGMHIINIQAYHTPVTSTEFIKSDFSSGWVLIPVGQSNEHLYNPSPFFVWYYSVLKAH